MQWREDFNIGVKAIDAQHQQLVEMIRRLQAAFDQQALGREVGEVLKGLVDYSGRHFAEEEAFMAAMNYPGLSLQQAQHREFTQKLVTVLLDLKAGKPLDVAQLIDFLKQWWVEHILKEDRKIGSAFQRLHKRVMADPTGNRTL